MKNETEDPDYLSRQVITYIGNKRNLLGFIDTGVKEVRKRLGRDKLKIFDVFSGSGIVARYFKRFSEKLVVNDLEKYSEVINRCYLSNRDEIDIPYLEYLYNEITEKLDRRPLKEGFIYDLYAPNRDEEIEPGERVFYTARNARYLDTARMYIGEILPEFRDFFIAPLLSEASVHANTAGVFKGFYRNPKTGKGLFGGSKGDALSRIKGDIRLPFPVFSRFGCEVEIRRGDALEVAETVGETDLAYLDPPYNQHPYGSNYFMLNLLSDYKRPERVSRVSGIPVDWNRSAYNRKRDAAGVFSRLVEKIEAKFLLVSFNSEGFISEDEMIGLLGRNGSVSVFERKYNTYRGSRNLRNRGIHVKEYLYLLEKK